MKFKSTQIAGALAMSLLLTGAVGTTAFAASADAAATAPTAQTQVAEEESKKDTAVLASQAKITEAEAITIAENANAGCTFTVDELDSEGGIIIYDLKGTDQNGGKIKVEVNAVDGTIIADSEQDVQNESESDSDENSDKTDDESVKATEDPALEQQEQAALAAQAKITEADAIAAAEAANSDYTFTTDGLDNENGVAVYDLKGTNAGGATLEVKVNAIDGSITAEADGEYEG